MNHFRAGAVRTHVLNPVLALPFTMARSIQRMPVGLRVLGMGVYNPKANRYLRSKHGMKCLAAIMEEAPQIYNAFSTTLDDQLFIVNLAYMLGGTKAAEKIEMSNAQQAVFNTYGTRPDEAPSDTAASGATGTMTTSEKTREAPDDDDDLHPGASAARRAQEEADLAVEAEYADGSDDAPVRDAGRVAEEFARAIYNGEPMGTGKLKGWQKRILSDRTLMNMYLKQKSMKAPVYALLDILVSENEVLRDVMSPRQFTLVKMAQVKSRGYNPKMCLDIIQNALGVPKGSYEQVMMIEYYYALHVNKLARSMYPEVGPLASPYFYKKMRDKLSETGLKCLIPNPNRKAGEPHYMASCFRSGISEPGTDDRMYISVKLPGSGGSIWQKLASDQANADLASVQHRKNEIKNFDDLIQGRTAEMVAAAGETETLEKIYGDVSTTSYERGELLLGQSVMDDTKRANTYKRRRMQEPFGYAA